MKLSPNVIKHIRNSFAYVLKHTDENIDELKQVLELLEDSTVTVEITVRTDGDIVTEIERLQAVQKCSHWTSARWQEASKHLAVLFNEMARRYPYD